MQLFINPERAEWPKLLQRPSLNTANLDTLVTRILDEIRAEGDIAIQRFTAEFDGVQLADFQVSPAEIREAEAQLPDDLKKAIQTAKANIEKFHAVQAIAPEVIETMPGVHCWRKSVPIERVGLYIPGGTAPLFSTVLMLGIPAKLAGCQEIVLCSPPDRNGRLHPAIIYTANLVGIDKLFKVGGVQAIGGMAYGTASIPNVYKIMGPGNQYVTAAKQMVSRKGIAIDMPAGPSEVLVCADRTANPAFVAADLLSQAEHGIDSQVVLVVFEVAVANAVQVAITEQLAKLPRRDIAEKALANSISIVVDQRETALELINAYAPEHLILAIEDAEILGEQVLNAGSIFLGHYTPESVGDYASGTNHTLPTNGYARAYSGVSLDTFVKKITFQRLSPEGLRNVGPAVELMAAAEALMAHKEAVTIRLDSLSVSDVPNL